MNWLKKLICGRELAALKSEIKQLKKELQKLRLEYGKLKIAGSRQDFEEGLCLFYELDKEGKFNLEYRYTDHCGSYAYSAGLTPLETVNENVEIFVRELIKQGMSIFRCELQDRISRPLSACLSQLERLNLLKK